QTIDENGVRALTRVKVFARGADYCVVEARPETGRMHQIRAHLNHVGHPIVGDKVYGAQTALAQNAIALCAYAVSFPAPSGGRHFVTIDPSPEVVEFCKQHHLDFQEKLKAEQKKFSKV